MRIGIYIETKNYENIDFSHPELGNPGIRGTQYMMWILACNLVSKTTEVFVYAPFIDTMPKYLHCQPCVDEKESIKKAAEDDMDIMILRAKEENITLYQELQSQKTKYILWSHNFENYELVNVIAKNPSIKRLVCVGKQQYDRLRDHPVFAKATYIYNALDFRNFDSERLSAKKPIVTYIGALNQLKGFHKLAKAWPKIKRQVPDAQLYVLGSGTMGNHCKTGKYGLAEPKYEKKFIKWLLNSEGEISKDVHFLGNVGGKTKDDIIKMTKVGVANPTGIGETFCIVATEFEAFGVPVVSKKGYGLLDTVVDRKSGILINSDQKLIDAIVFLLKNDKACERYGSYGKKYVRSKFSLPHIVKQWKKLIKDVYDNSPVNLELDCNSYFNQAKWLREINRRIQKTKWGRWSPSLLIYEAIWPNALKCVLNLKRRIMCK